MEAGGKKDNTVITGYEFPVHSWDFIYQTLLAGNEFPVSSRDVTYRTLLAMGPGII
jgi:hypothetical protein